jgi:hypothetical protein
MSGGATVRFPGDPPAEEQGGLPDLGGEPTWHYVIHDPATNTDIGQFAQRQEALDEALNQAGPLRPLSVELVIVERIGRVDPGAELQLDMAALRSNRAEQIAAAEVPTPEQRLAMRTALEADNARFGRKGRAGAGFDGL